MPTPFKISVAMATFNGEDFLKEQLNSIANQSRLPFELIVSDDRSEDRTIEIVKEFAKFAKFSVVLYENEKRLGFADNFFNAAKKCSGDWIIFCDQDDFWLPNRISASEAVIYQNPTANLILHNAYLCDSNLKITSSNLFPKKIKEGLYEKSSLPGFFVWPGFLQTVNSDVLKLEGLCQRPKHFFDKFPSQTHDTWTCMIANAIGGTIIENTPVALYRRHKGAVTSSIKKISIKEKIIISEKIGIKEYLYKSDIALESANHLKCIAEATDNDELRSDMYYSAAQYQKFSRNFRERSKIYSSKSRISALKVLVKFAMSSGYVGNRFFASGWKSLIKDIRVILTQK